MKITHILIPSDLSPEAVRPCRPVAELARALGARITLLHVTEDPPISPFTVTGESIEIPSDLSERMATARTQLEGDRASFSGLDASVEVIAGPDAIEAILAFAAASRVDLIAMSTHGRKGWRRMVLGSVAELVLRRSTVPVVVFPRAEPDQADRKSA